MFDKHFVLISNNNNNNLERKKIKKKKRLEIILFQILKEIK